MFVEALKSKIHCATVTVICYAQMTPEELDAHEPTIIMVDSQNRIKEIRGREHHSETA